MEISPLLLKECPMKNRQAAVDRFRCPRRSATTFQTLTDNNLINHKLCWKKTSRKGHKAVIRTFE